MSKPPYVRAHFVERLISGICHDIGAPARHAVQFTQLLNDNLDENTDSPMEEKHKRWLSMVHDSGKEIQTMLSSLPILSRLSMRSSEMIQLDLHDLWNRSFSFHKECTISDGTQIEITVNEAWPTIVGCEEHWRMLFSCLLENAFVFQPKTSEHVIQLAVYCELVETELRFSLEDNGIGVSENQRKEMSRAFKRLNGRDEYPGIGMGLTYCEYIAELNNATLSFAESSLGGLLVSYSQPYIQSHTQLSP